MVLHEQYTAAKFEDRRPGRCRAGGSPVQTVHRLTFQWRRAHQSQYHRRPHQNTQQPRHPLRLFQEHAHRQRAFAVVKSTFYLALPVVDNASGATLRRQVRLQHVHAFHCRALKLLGIDLPRQMRGPSCPSSGCTRRGSPRSCIPGRFQASRSSLRDQLLLRFRSTAQFLADLGHVPFSGLFFLPSLRLPTKINRHFTAPSDRSPHPSKPPWFRRLLCPSCLAADGLGLREVIHLVHLPRRLSLDTLQMRLRRRKGKAIARRHRQQIAIASFVSAM